MANVIVGTGSYLPEHIVTNEEIEAAVVDYDRTRAEGVSLDQWARAKHGGVSRHRAAPGEATSDLATQAARRALADANIDVADDAVDLIVMSTFTSDHRVPQSAGIVQANLHSTAKFIQIDAGCSGFIDALLVAHGMMETHGYETALVVCADTFVNLNHPRAFMPLTIFGDGAGAVVLRRDDTLSNYGIRAFATGSDGDLGHYVCIPGGGSRMPFSEQILRENLHYLTYKFPQIRTWAIDRMLRGTREVIERARIDLHDVKWVVPHQASLNIMNDFASQLDLPGEVFVSTYAHTGNTSGASIPIALNLANERHTFADGDWLVMPSAGAGMAWGAVAYRWYDYRRQSSPSI